MHMSSFLAGMIMSHDHDTTHVTLPVMPCAKCRHSTSHPLQQQQQQPGAQQLLHNSSRTSRRSSSSRRQPQQQVRSSHSSPSSSHCRGHCPGPKPHHLCPGRSRQQQQQQLSSSSTTDASTGRWSAKNLLLQQQQQQQQTTQDHHAAAAALQQHHQTAGGAHVARPVRSVLISARHVSMSGDITCHVISPEHAHVMTMPRTDTDFSLTHA